MEQRNKIKRSWPTTIGFLIGGIAAIGFAIVLIIEIERGDFRTQVARLVAVGAVLLICVGIFLVVLIFNGSGSADCPVCGSHLWGISTKSNDAILCSDCLKYLEGNNGMIWATDENRIADEPIFRSRLPDSPRFPEKCCVCGQSDIANEKISSLLGTARGVNPGNRWVTVEVPHCGEHTGGALVDGDQEDPYIAFRSYPYLREFCQLNGTVPGRYDRVKKRLPDEGNNR